MAQRQPGQIFTNRTTHDKGDLDGFWMQWQAWSTAHAKARDEGVDPAVRSMFATIVKIQERMINGQHR